MVHIKVPSLSGGELLLTIAASLALVAGVLAAVTTGVAWATASSGGAELEYHASEAKASFSGFGGSVDYSEEDFDDAEGIGLLRAGGPLLIVGVVLAFLSMAGLVVGLFVRGAFVTLGSASGAALASVFLVLAVILLPIGISQNLEESGLDPSWGAGLILAIIGTALMLGATALAFIARFQPPADLS